MQNDNIAKESKMKKGQQREGPNFLRWHQGRTGRKLSAANSRGLRLITDRVARIDFFSGEVLQTHHCWSDRRALVPQLRQPRTI